MRLKALLVALVALLAGASTTTTAVLAAGYTCDASAFAHVGGPKPAKAAAAEAGRTQPSEPREGSAAWSARVGGRPTTSSIVVNATNTGSALADASSAAFRAADDPASIFIKNKHLASAGGNHAKFASESISEVQGWVAQGLRSDGVQFLPNQLDGTFRAIVPAGQVVGTKGQTFIRVIVTDDGRVINAFPVVAG